MNHILIKMAIPKLNKAPINIYSVSSILLLSFKSLNLKTDFAAIKKLITSQRPKMMKAKTKKCSIIPMYMPAFGKDLWSISICLDMLSSNLLIIIAVGKLINISAVTNFIFIF